MLLYYCTSLNLPEVPSSRKCHPIGRRYMNAVHLWVPGYIFFQKGTPVYLALCECTSFSRMDVKVLEIHSDHADACCSRPDCF